MRSKEPRHVARLRVLGVQLLDAHGEPVHTCADLVTALDRAPWSG